jgi:cytochrome c peroxidase
MSSIRLHHAIAAASAIVMALALGCSDAMPAADFAGWSTAERAILRTMSLSALEPAAKDPSNAYEGKPAAAALGKRLFFDARFSANGQISCASCHDPARQFQDGRELGTGVATGLRRTMPIAESGRGPWLFWDGRKDSLWSQALGPMEDAREHGGNRMAFVHLIKKHYRKEYETIFASLPSLEGLPAAASPLGTHSERTAWAAMGPEQQAAVSRVFANMGKAIAAYEKSLAHTPSRLDRYIDASLAQAPGAEQLLTAPEKRGLRLFIGKAACVSCHAGPLLTDQAFHNTGVGPRRLGAPDRGRIDAVHKVRQDEFNCQGKFSDTEPSRCLELEFMVTNDPLMVGAFKTPGLRNVAERAPYMHAGQVPTLAAAIRHYTEAPRAAVGKNERRAIALSEQEQGDLVAFLATLSSPIVESPVQEKQ